MVLGWMLAAHPLPLLAGGPAIWLALSWRAWGCGRLAACFLEIRLRDRNTQLATGLRFVAVVLGFLGERTGALPLRTLLLLTLRVLTLPVLIREFSHWEFSHWEFLHWEFLHWEFLHWEFLHWEFLHWEFLHWEF
jgi:hypothetical protein